MSCTQQHLSFQHTPGNLHNIASSLLASLHYIHLYHNVKATEVDSLWTSNKRTKGQPQRTGEGICWGKNANIG